ncbi:MFS transporter [Nesterenkonia ebinurensis]|uniref:MFS transporter n=1 Tax=Nesterenkonia ebinurensis TaxID=2608252 RepID=UPI00123DF142|nr:MFS transporter [Nesterenkonia ebinurensis]
MEKHFSRADTVKFQCALFCLALAAFTQMYALQGVLPHVSQDWMISASDAALTVSFAMAGVACGVVPSAWAGDRYGKLRCLKISLAVSVTTGFLVPLMPNYQILLGVRFISGMALAAIPVLAIAYVRETFNGRIAALGAGAYIAGMAAGGAGGRVIAGPLAPMLGWRGAVLVAALASLIIALVFYWGIPRLAQQHERSAASQRSRFKKALGTITLWRLYAQGFLMTGIHVGMYNYIAFRLQEAPFFLAPGIASLVFFAYFAGTISSRFGAAWMERFGYQATMALGGTTLLVGLVGMLSAQLWLVITGLVVYTAGFFVTQTAAVTTIGNEADSTFRSQTSAAFTICFYLGSGVLGWALGLVFEARGWTVMSICMGGMILLCLTLSLLIRPRSGPAG